MNIKLIAIPAIALAGGIGLAACGSSSDRSSAGSSSASPVSNTVSPAPGDILFSCTGTGTPSIHYGNGTTDIPVNGHTDPTTLLPVMGGTTLPWSAQMPYDSSQTMYGLSAHSDGGDINIHCSMTRDGTVLATGQAGDNGLDLNYQPNMGNCQTDPPNNTGC